MKTKQKQPMTMEEQIEKAEQLIQTTPIEGTPFVIVHHTENNTFFGALANYRLTELYDNFDLAKKETKKMNWDNIVKVIAIIVEQFNNKNNTL